MLQITNLACERDDRQLFSQLTVTARQGELLQIVGANGSGKSTFLRIVCGLALASEGEVHWQGKAVSLQYASFASQLLYLGHHTGLKAALTPRENLALLQALQTSSMAKESHAIIGDPSATLGMTQVLNEGGFSATLGMTISAALITVGLAGFEDVPTRYLSAGQQRRIALARLLVQPANLWLLDEPFAALDGEGVALVEQLLSQKAQQGGVILLTSHRPLALPNLPPCRYVEL